MKAVTQPYVGTSAGWKNYNPRLYLGVKGIEIVSDNSGTPLLTPQGNIQIRIKIGDGKKPWNDLPYLDIDYVPVGGKRISERLKTLESMVPANMPSEDGTYTLQMVISGGIPAYSWI
jgi:hypothetical protein